MDEDERDDDREAAAEELVADIKGVTAGLLRLLPLVERAEQSAEPEDRIFVLGVKLTALRALEVADAELTRFGLDDDGPEAA